MGKTYSLDGTLLDPELAAYPCGIVAKSYFNDTFELYKQNVKQNQSREIRMTLSNQLYSKVICSISFNNVLKIN